MMEPRIINDHIVFSHPDSHQIAAMIPEAKRTFLKGTEIMAVPYTLNHTMFLRNMGVNAPSPIRTRYKWSGIYQPRWYQVDTSEQLTLNKRFFCLNAQRTGKTLSTLWAADFLKRQGLVRKVLIVAPLSTLERVWADNIFMHFPHRNFVVLHGASDKRKELLNKDVDFYIVNHHGVKVLHKELLAKQDIDLIVIDEVAVMRNSQTKNLWKPLKQLIRPEQWVWGLTGTPTSQAPTDAYGIAKLIKPENIPMHFTAFKQLTMQQFGPFRWVPRRGAEDIVAKVLSPSIRFDRTVCTDMEPCLIERTCELSEEQKKHYKQLYNQAVTEVRGNNITAVNAAVLVSKLVQVACGVVYAADGKTVEIDFGHRFAVLEELIEENENKVIVFVPFTGVLDAIARELRKKWTVEVVDGGVSAGKRNQIFHDFQNNKNPHIIVAHPATMAHGLDLTAADLIVWYAPHNSNEQYLQACARIDGSKQKTKIDIAHIYATKVERKAFENLRQRGNWQKVLLDIVKEGGL